jgi:hypothetical protein
MGNWGNEGDYDFVASIVESTVAVLAFTIASLLFDLYAVSFAQSGYNSTMD